MFFSAIRDVSKWSAKMRQPLEEVYGTEGFPKLWEAWIDGVIPFAKKPNGTDILMFLTTWPHGHLVASYADILWPAAKFFLIQIHAAIAPNRT